MDCRGQHEVRPPASAFHVPDCAVEEMWRRGGPGGDRLLGVPDVHMKQILAPNYACRFGLATNTAPNDAKRTTVTVATVVIQHKQGTPVLPTCIFPVLVFCTAR